MPRQSKYTAVHHLPIVWRRALGCESELDMALMGNFFKLLESLQGIDEYVNNAKFLIVEDGPEALDKFKKRVQDHDNERVLFIVTYSGHSGVHNWRLIATYEPPDEDDLIFELTSLQLYVRDSCKADFLFILESCHSGFFPSEKECPRSKQADNHLVEILSATEAYEEGKIDLEEWRDFNQRLAHDLIHNPGRAHDKTQVEHRYVRIHRPDFSTPGCYQSVGKRTGSINLLLKSRFTEDPDDNTWMEWNHPY